MTRFHPCQAVISDLDRTLVDSAADRRAAQRKPHAAPLLEAAHGAGMRGIAVTFAYTIGRPRSSMPTISSTISPICCRLSSIRHHRAVALQRGTRFLGPTKQ
jgi:hypothetical protein